MMNEAPDLERKKIALLTAIAGGRVVTDANATDDERMTINAMLDQYITKSGDPALEPLLLNTLPTSDFGRKLRAVQAALRIAVDGRFGEGSIMGITRAGGDTSSSLEDLLADMPKDAPSSLGPSIVGSTGTGTQGVKVGPGPKVGLPSRVPVVQQTLGKMFTAGDLTRIKQTAQAMQARGQDPTDFLRKVLGEKSKELGAMQADLLLASLGIKPGGGSSPLPPAPAPLEERRLMPERKRYRS